MNDELLGAGYSIRPYQTVSSKTLLCVVTLKNSRPSVTNLYLYFMWLIFSLLLSV